MSLENEVYKENYELKKKIEQIEEDLRLIHRYIYCIGGPLNDNVLLYTDKQKVIFSKIVSIVNQYL